MTAQYLRMAARYLWSRKGRSFMTLAGIALGVTMVVAVLLINGAILGSYENLLAAAAGRADLQVSATTGFGFDEDLLEVARQTPGVAVAAPVIASGTQVVSGDRQAGATFYGIDRDLDQQIRTYRMTAGRLPEGPGEAAITTDLAANLALSEGDGFSLLTTRGLQAFTVVGIFDAQGTVRGALGPFGVITLGAAQEAFGKAGKLDVIDIVAAEGEPTGALQERLAVALDPQVRVTTPVERSRDMQRLLDSVVFLLTMAGSISLFAGTFIIYANVSMSVAERRRELSILRALGLRRGEVIASVLTEAALLGFLGALLGLAYGYGMARVMADQATQQFLAGYGVQAAAVAMDLGTVAAALAVGVGAALAAAFGPARETVMVSPVEAMRPAENPGVDPARPGWRRGAAGLALLAVGFLTVWLTWPESEMLSPLVLRLWGLMLVVALLGMVLLLPVLLPLANRALLRPLLTAALGVTGRLAADNLIRMPRRTAATISALMVTLTYMVAMGGVEASQMATFNQWFEKNIGWDMNVSSSYAGIGALVEVDDAFVQQLAEVEGVRLVSPQKMMRVIIGDGDQAFLQVFDHSLLRQYSETMLEEGSWPEVADLMEQGGHAVISPGIAARLGVGVGGTLRLPSPSGEVAFTVAGIMTDITPYGGTINIDRRDYLRYWNDSTVSNVAVLVEEGVSPEEVKQRILDRWGDTMPLNIRLNRDFWNELKVAYDSFYGLTEALTWVAVLVAGLAIANTLVTAILERKREFGVLRAVGTRRGEVVQVVLGEAFSMGVVGGLIGAVAGLGLQRAMVASSELINGATMHWVLDWGSLGTAAVVALILAPLSGLLPARWAARLDVVDALRYE
ncbi:FtsX-like permease family protein [Symbiobacterium terraclitae]|uniref:FtsX-like permease family protein n=1 Tax=Symbiobacterium terraclitae TaxID=557451 RepID=UPI0035B55D2E